MDNSNGFFAICDRLRIFAARAARKRRMLTWMVRVGDWTSEPIRSPCFVLLLPMSAQMVWSSDLWSEIVFFLSVCADKAFSKVWQEQPKSIASSVAQGDRIRSSTLAWHSWKSRSLPENGTIIELVQDFRHSGFQWKPVPVDQDLNTQTCRTKFLDTKTHMACTVWLKTSFLKLSFVNLTVDCSEDEEQPFASECQRVCRWRVARKWFVSSVCVCVCVCVPVSGC